MANRRRWAALRYARLIAEVKRDTEVASAVEVGASNTVSQIANGNVIAVSNTQFQGYISNTNSRLTTLESDISVQASNGFITSTFTTNTVFQSALANTNTYIATKADSSSLTQYLQVANASSVSAITDLSDVDISGATDGQVLTYNSGNGTITATTVSGGGGSGGVTTGKAIAMAIVFG